MFAKKKFTCFTPAGAARFLVGVAALLALSVPALAQTQTFATGDYCTYTQGGWGAVPQGNNPGTILHNNFLAIYTSGVEVGVPGTSGFSMKFTTADGVTNYLPAGGKPKPLTADYTNPLSTSSGVFGGQVLALQLNVDFSDYGLPFPSPPASFPLFGDLQITGTGTSFDGMTVRQLLNEANIRLGTNPPTTLPANLNDIVTFLNQGFDNCLPSGWAQQYLIPGLPPPDLPPPS